MQFTSCVIFLAHVDFFNLLHELASYQFSLASNAINFVKILDQRAILEFDSSLVSLKIQCSGRTGDRHFAIRTFHN